MHNDARNDFLAQFTYVNIGPHTVALELGVQELGVVADVLSDEGGDEEVRVVVALLHVEPEPHALLRARRREVLGQQLLLHVEVVVRALKASS